MRYSPFTAMDIVSDRRRPLPPPSAYAPFSSSAPLPVVPPLSLPLPPTRPGIRQVKHGAAQRNNRIKPVDPVELSHRLRIVLAQQQRREAGETDDFAPSSWGSISAVPRSLATWERTANDAAAAVPAAPVDAEFRVPKAVAASRHKSLPASKSTLASTSRDPPPPLQIARPPRTFAAAVAAASRHTHKAEHANQPYVPRQAARQFSQTTTATIAATAAAPKPIFSKIQLRRHRSTNRPATEPEAHTAHLPMPTEAPHVADETAAQSNTGAKAEPPHLDQLSENEPLDSTEHSAHHSSDESLAQQNSNSSSGSNDSRRGAKWMATRPLPFRKGHVPMVVSPDLTKRTHRKLYNLSLKPTTRKFVDPEEHSDELSPMAVHELPLSPLAAKERRVDWSQSDTTAVVDADAADVVDTADAAAAAAAVVPETPTHDRPKDRLRTTKSLWALRSRLSFSKEKHPPSPPALATSVAAAAAMASSPSLPLASPTLKSPKSSFFSQGAENVL